MELVCKLSEIAAKYGTYYYPIVSSSRAFSNMEDLIEKLQIILGGVVYEDPWLAGGHNGLSNNEDPLSPHTYLGKDLKIFMNKFDLKDNPNHNGWRSLESIQMGRLVKWQIGKISFPVWCKLYSQRRKLYQMLGKATFNN